MTYGEGRPAIPGIPVPTVMFMINKSYRPDSTEIEIYEATRKSWKIGEQARERAFYALGVSNGVVRGAYRIDQWLLMHSENNRWAFEGVSATELIGVVGSSIERIKAAQGASSPVR